MLGRIDIAFNFPTDAYGVDPDRTYTTRIFALLTGMAEATVSGLRGFDPADLFERFKLESMKTDTKVQEGPS